MRDYKYVKVPRGQRTARNRLVTKRIDAGPARRKSGPRPGNAAATVAGLLLTAALGYGTWQGWAWLSRAGMFQIAGVDVQGVRRVSDAEIRGLAGMFTGQNIFRVDLDAATKKALTDPWVRDVRIERSLPNRIRIVFTERSPCAVLQAANGRFLIDREAVVIAPAGPAEAAGLPVIAVRDQRVSLRDAVTSDGMAPALELLGELAARGGWDLTQATVRADSAESLSVVYGGHEFRIGDGNYDEKLRRLGEIVNDMNRRNQDYSYVELRPARQAAVMLKTQGRGAGEADRARKKRV
jgi:cell division septal protein FtsQ